MFCNRSSPNNLMKMFLKHQTSQRRLEKLLYSDRFFRDDFAVVLQPFLKHADPPRLAVNSPHQKQSSDGIIRMPSVTAVAMSPMVTQSMFVCLCEQNGKVDMTFFTHDCFHFTIKGHEELAKGLWNNMVNYGLCRYDS